MPRESLLEYFGPQSRPAKEIALAWRRGYRMVRWTYGDLLRVAKRFAGELDIRGVAKGDRVLLWGENCGEWVAAFLGCMFRGVIAVPMDAIADKGFAARVAKQADVKLAVVGHGLPSFDADTPVIRLEDLSALARTGPPKLFRRLPSRAVTRLKSSSPREPLRNREASFLLTEIF